MFLARIRVTLKPTVNDPQGQTVLSGLKTLGFHSARSVRVGKYMEVQLDAPDHRQAEAQARAICDKLLANPVIEDFDCEVSEVSEAEDSSQDGLYNPPSSRSKLRWA